MVRRWHVQGRRNLTLRRPGRVHAADTRVTRAHLLIGLGLTFGALGCSAQESNDEDADVRSAAFPSCEVGGLTDLPSDAEVFGHFFDWWLSIGSGPPAEVTCLFAPGATITFGPASEDPAPADLASFWNDLYRGGGLATSPPPASIVRHVSNDAIAEFSYIFDVEGTTPLRVRYEKVGSVWLITSFTSGLACEDLDADLLALVSEFTCPR
jgi:hypothetical protein